MFSIDFEHAQQDAAAAKQAGDPSREADVRVSMDIDQCVLGLGNYLPFLERVRIFNENRQQGLPTPESAEEQPGEKKRLDESLSFSIAQLRKDLGE